MTAIAMTLLGCAPKKTAETTFVIDYDEEGVKPKFTQVIRKFLKFGLYSRYIFCKQMPK